MHKGRLEAFSDGVLAIIITIMVLELKVPHELHVAPSFANLLTVWPVFLSYILSFIYIGIYWNNHHHLFQAVHSVSGATLWANLHLLFWLSLIPFTTGWLGENHFAAAPAALYGIVLLMAAIAWWLLERAILSVPGGNPVLASAIRKNLKEKLSPVLYVIAILLAFVVPWLACILYLAVALLWLIPDRRIERSLAASR